MRTQDVAVLAGVGIAGYFLYQFFGAAKTALIGATGSATTGIANLWVSLTAQPPMMVLGSVAFPDGSSQALSSLPVRTDAAGNVYVQYAGHVYQLGQSNLLTGDWPATLVQ